MSKETTEEFTTTEDIQKAVEELTEEGFFSQEDEFSKGDNDDDDDDDDENEDEDSSTNAEVEEGEGDDDDDEDDDDEEKGAATYKAMKKGGKTYYKKMNKAGKPADDMFYKKGKKGYDKMTKDEIDGVMGKVKKSEDNDVDLDEEFEKAIEVSPVLQKLNNDMIDMQDRTEGKFKSTGTLLKALLEQNNNLQKSVAEMTEKLTNFSSEPKTQKSVTRPVERFAKAEGDGGKQLSLSNNKQEILDAMDEITFTKGFDESMASAMQRFEADGSIDAPIANRLAKEAGLTLTN